MDLRITCIGQRWRCAMTACTICRSYLHQSRMARCIGRVMQGLPTSAVTRLATAAGRKGLAERKADQVAGAVMTLSATRMRICIDKRISMTAGAVIGAGCRHD